MDACHGIIKRQASPLQTPEPLKSVKDDENKGDSLALHTTATCATNR